MTTCSPLLSLVQAVDNTAQTLNNSQASDRLKALQTASAVAQGYSAVADLAQGVLARAEVGVGFRYGESKERYYELTSQGNVINGKQGVSLNATDGSITLNKTDLTTKDAYGQLNKAGEVRLSAQEHIQLYSGRSEMESESKRTHYGAQVGTGVQVGANSGWYLYAEGGLGQDKSKSHIHHKDNSHIQAGKLNIQAGGDVTLKGASAYAEQIQGHIGGKLYIESEQSHERHSQSSAGLNGRVQGGYGAWGGSVSGQYAQGNGRLSQVEEQAGLFAGNGGYQLVAKETHLKGGAIASTNAAKSFLATNHLRFEDIKNESGSKALSLSGGLSYSTGGNKEKSQGENPQSQNSQASPTNRGSTGITSGQYWEKVSNEIGKPLQGEGGQGFSSSLGLPQYEKHTDSSVTRATLTAGTLILNKDSQPIITTPEAIGINTDLNLANEQVEKPKDIQRLLTEQKATAQALSDMANAAGVYARHKWQETGDERWKDGGSHKRKLDAAVAALGTALGGGSFGQVATAAISPELNAKIHELTKDNKTTNLLAHAALSALEAKATGHSATAGAAAGLIGEGSAMLLSETVLKKPTELLTAEERSLLKTVGLVSGAAAGGVVGGNTASAAFGAETGKRAVENNYLNNLEVENLVRELAQAEKEGKGPKAIFEKYQQISEANRQAMLDECGNNPSCYLKHIYQMGTGSKEAEDNISAWGVTSYTKPSGKLTGEMVNFVDKENGKSYAVLPNSVHYAGLAIEGAAAAGLGGLGIKDIKGYLTKQPVVTPPKGYEKQDAKLRVSTGAENVALYPKLKEQLRQENLSNMVKVSPLLEHAAFGKDNLTAKGIVLTRADSDSLGKTWVGDGAREISQGGLISADGTRLYRAPTPKKYSPYAETGMQSNFQRGYIDPKTNKFVSESNLHINIRGE